MPCVEQLNYFAYICIVEDTSHQVAPFGTGQEIDNDERLKKKKGARNYCPESEDLHCKRGQFICWHRS